MLKLEEFMWKFGTEQAKPPHMFRVLPYHEGREFFFAFVILIFESLAKEKDYMNHLRQQYTEMYNKFAKEEGILQLRFRRDPAYFTLTGDYGKLLKKIKDTVDPNSIMHPSMNIFD